MDVREGPAGDGGDEGAVGCSSNVGAHNHSGGLHLALTAGLRALLRDACELCDLPPGDGEAAAALAAQPDGAPAPYALLRRLAQCLRAHQLEGGSAGTAWLHRATAGSDILLNSPRIREKSPELQARLAELQDAADRRAYDELVHDVSRRAVAEQGREYVSSYRDQLGFGLHVILTMFTGFMSGWTLLKAISRDVVLHTAGGTLGLVAGMLLETVLYMIRVSRAEERQRRKHRQSSTTRQGAANEARHDGLPAGAGGGQGGEAMLSLPNTTGKSAANKKQD
eukprot:SM000029S10542  [mRNA]  locus=s29:767396:768903:+ [translate_table: standard]